MVAADAFFVTVSCVIRGHHVYKEVWNPSIGEAFVFWMVLASRWRTPHLSRLVDAFWSWRWLLVASNLNVRQHLQAYTLLPNLRQVQIPLSGTVPEVYSYI